MEYIFCSGRGRLFYDEIMLSKWVLFPGLYRHNANAVDVSVRHLRVYLFNKSLFQVVFFAAAGHHQYHHHHPIMAFVGRDQLRTLSEMGISESV